MNHFPEAWGRPRNDVYGPYNHSYLPHQHSAPIQHTQSPTVTGTSVVALKFKDGVFIAADNLASYGSLARFPDVKRLRRFNNKAVVGFGGDVSDMQYIDRLLNSLSIRENYAADNSTEEQPNAMNARNLYIYLSKVMYQRRSNFDPLWNHIIVAGLDEDNKPFLASVDLLGTTFSAPSLATGYGTYLAQPILRKTVPDEESVANVDEEEAEHAIQEAMKVLFCRDARSLPTYSIALVTEEGGVELMEEQKLENQSWAFADRIKGYGTQTK